MHFFTANFPMGPQSSGLSPEQISVLLRGKRFGTDEEPAMFPPDKYTEEDMKELEEYCRKRGIIGVSFQGMNPKAVLKMLKAKTGDRSDLNETKKELLHG